MFTADRVPDEEHEMILGISEFEESLKLFHARKYDQCEVYLKQALGIVKNAQQEQSLGYLYLLKRLAYVCF